MAKGSSVGLAGTGEEIGSFCYAQIQIVLTSADQTINVTNPEPSDLV